MYGCPGTLHVQNFFEECNLKVRTVETISKVLLESWDCIH